MTQYIDKDSLVAEIKECIETYNKSYANGDDRRADALEILLHNLDTIEVKEVDLEKEIDKIDDAIPGKREDIEYIAKRFFELGLNTKQTSEDIKIGETKIYLDDDGGEPPYDGKQWLDLGCTEYEIPLDKFKDGDNVEIIIRKTQKGE